MAEYMFKGSEIKKVLARFSNVLITQSRHIHVRRKGLYASGTGSHIMNETIVEANDILISGCPSSKSVGHKRAEHPRCT